MKFLIAFFLLLVPMNSFSQSTSVVTIKPGLGGGGGGGGTAVSVVGKIPFNITRHTYAGGGNVTTAAYTQLVASTSLIANAIEIFDSSGQTLFLAIGAGGSEVNQVYILPGGNGVIPLLIAAGSRVSIKAVSANATAGEIDINFYN